MILLHLRNSSVVVFESVEVVSSYRLISSLALLLASKAITAEARKNGSTGGSSEERQEDDYDGIEL